MTTAIEVQTERKGAGKPMSQPLPEKGAISKRETVTLFSETKYCENHMLQDVKMESSTPKALGP